ncbi:MAG: hypothetical protein GWN67_15535 [Phycisphaerae bacterium]|nr:hypothetical protein [Phycisphaerae bacterium]NIP51048.1 hypothetical protein [Phycisphaerae bacterium]NIS52492.1 hypothetical protein [Phycisphaerae bacterium]NIU10027.1 hypothetical protein [Phycisphaerae bacterium]NIU57746.1 hypothetical protein [Phycisphaerae bacterium]
MVTKLWIAAAAASVALFIVTAASLIVMNQDGSENVKSPPQQMTLAIQELRSVYWKVGRDLPTSWPRVIDEPLASEFQNLASDTESAVRFLVACVAVDIADTKRRSVN